MTTIAARAPAGAGVYAGLFFTTLSTLMYEILLTRIFSVTMWYHFAFVAVSVALFGLTVGALLVHLFPASFPLERTGERLAQASLAFSLAIVGSFVLHVWVPFEASWSPIAVGSTALTYVAIAVPFVCSGVAVSLSLTRFPSQVSRLYAIDLVGAGLGTVTLVWLLDVLGDGPSAVVAIAALAAVGAGGYALEARRGGLVALAALGAVALAAFAFGNAIAAWNEQPILRVRHAKGQDEGVALYERWNAFSRIRVAGDEELLQEQVVAEEGASGRPRIRQLGVTIDAAAGTPLTRFDGDRRLLDERFRNKVVNAAHFLRPDARVLIVGTGGGWDVLAALAFEQPEITAVEMNGAMLHVVNERFGDFTGHLDRQPEVTFVHDEARSYLERSNERYDIIQVPMTDTWAATAAGAFALTENALYTVEAWRTFYDHLRPGGVIGLNRWYFAPRPMEAYRLTSLAARALREEGVARPRDHIMLVRSAQFYPDVAVVTILLGRDPFAREDVATIVETARDLGWEVLLAPHWPRNDPTLVRIAEAEDPRVVDLPFPGDISPPTDDRPYFFQMIGFADVFDASVYGGFNDYLAKPVLVLLTLAVIVVALAGLCIVGPLLLTTSSRAIAAVAPLVLFFAAIGMGFLLLEIAQMQRLIIFLGHPTYALSVVLFSLLIFSGLGSLATERLANPGGDARLRIAVLVPLGALLAVLVVFAYLTPATIERFEASTTPVRIGASVAVLAPMGLLMGMPFPLGMKVAALRPGAPTAFFWGVNGATSVVASVFAVVISMGWGISNAYWAGVLAYAVAAAAMGSAVARGRA